MEEKMMNIEVAISHMELLLRFHQRSMESNPLEYNDSFKHGQQLIFDDIFPALEKAKKALNQLKEELQCQNS